MNSVAANPIEYFDALKSDYQGVKRGRHKRVLTGLPAGGSHADYHYRTESDFLKMIETARHFDRDDPIVGQGIGRVTSNVIQQGFTLDTTTGDTELNKHLTDRWGEWSENRDFCDAQGEMSFKRMESLVFRSVVRDGDIFGIPLSNGKLRLYEGHRPRTPRGTKNVVHGIELDGNRRRKGLHLTREDVGIFSTVKTTDVYRVPWRDDLGNRLVFQVYNPDRVTQTRGVSATHAIVDMVGMHDDIQFANLVRQQVVSCFAVLRERMLGFDDGKCQSPTGPTTSDYALGTQRILEQIAPGMMIDGLPGEKLTGFSPNVPSPQFFEHSILILTFIAVNLNLPLQLLLLDPTKTNFSGWRGAIDQARLSFRQMQGWLVEQFHSEVYRWKVRQWLATDDALQDAFSSGVDIYSHKWHPPSWEYIEPNKDAQADDLIVSRGLNSRSAIWARRGLEYESTLAKIGEEMERELALSMDITDRLNTTYSGKNIGRPLDFREVAARFLPPAASAKLSGSVEEVIDEPAPSLDGGAV